jgi:putative membrane protein
MGGGAAPAAGAKLGNAEVEHGKRTALAGAVALQTSEIALKKAQNAKVKEFAQFEYDEQTTIAQILSAMDPSMGQARPDAKSADMIQRLNGMNGAQFDKAYVMGQIEGHQTLLAIQEDYIKAGSNREHVAIAKLARGMIKEHLVHLNELQKTMS